MILGRHNTRLVAIKDENDADKWTGDAEAYLVEALIKDDAERGDIWRSYLAIPSNLEAGIEPGDKAAFTWNATTRTREIRDVVERPLFGVIRLHFADR